MPTLFAASVILFIAINVVPGSAARSALGVDATPQAIMRFEASNGLDRPLAVQYTDWLGKALRGDFGTSFQNRVAVAPDILRRLPSTLELAFLAFRSPMLIALPLGALAAFDIAGPTDIAICYACDDSRRHSEFLARDPAGLGLLPRLTLLPAGGYTPFFDNPWHNLPR